jgi:nitrate/nitrite-specific signal transduction histidine kinase
MMKTQLKTAEQRLALMFGVFRSMATRLAADKSCKDSQEVSGLLAEARTKAIQLKQDAEEINSFVLSSSAWETHAAKFNEIKEYISNQNKLVTKMKKAKAEASPWQKQLINEVTSLLEELAASVTATIEYLKDNRDRLQYPSYPDYAAENAEYASDISQVISYDVAWGEAKLKGDDLARQIELFH